MFRKDTIYQKSAKGIEAMATRQHGLPPRLRSTLILVDGKRSFQELANLAATFGDAEQLLSQLSADGFIEEASGAVAVPSPSPAPTATPAAPALSLPEAQRFAVRRLTDLVGPTSEELCLRIEACRNAQEFLAAVSRAESLVRQFRGPETAAAFAAEMQSHRPR